ncbi:MAG TPA: helix-turn-helix transcriptional regulator [Thermoanaerobaculia bacterium]|nr:helix-turn-helix transcriptional regulator [Thermoanaerobaculia bacterium]
MLEARDVGRAIERLRGDRSQREVARRGQINRSSWSLYESGRRMPDPKSWPKIAHGLELTPQQLDVAVAREWLRRVQGDPRPAPAPEGQGAVRLSAPEAVELVACAERIGELTRHALGRTRPALEATDAES